MNNVRGWVRRHALSLIAGAALAVLSTYYAFLPRREGLNLWADFVSGLSQATVLTGPIAAGICALIASRAAAPLKLRVATAARTGSSVLARHAVGTIAPVAASFPIALILVAIYAMFSGTYGAPSAAWLVAIASATFLACVVGYFGGLLLASRWYAAPAISVGYLATYVLVQSVPVSNGVRSLFPAIINRDSEFVRHITVTMWGQTLFFLSLSFLVFLIAQGQSVRVERWRAIAAVPTVMVLAVAGATVLSTNGQYTSGFNARDFVCTGADPEICVNRGYREALNGLGERFDALNVKVAGTPLQVRRVEQNVEGVGDEPSEGARSIYIEGLGDSDLDQTVSRYVAKYGGSESCMLRADVPYDSLTASIIVDTWLSGFDEYGLNDLDPNALGAKEWQHFKSLDPRSGNAWFREHQEDYTACTLTLADLR